MFLDTIPNIDSVHKSIAELLQKDFVPSEYVILPLHGMITPEEQQKVFEPHFVESLDKYATKIILANKIAESSITIDGVTVVIDTGLAKEATYDPVRKITTIETEFISRAQAIQRRGRAGRTAVGICYRIYSEEDFLNLPPDKEPEIKKTNLDTVILKIMSLGI